MTDQKVVEIFETEVWIESDFLGRKHVMVRHCVDGFEPFCYCTFNYDYRYTCNTIIRNEAIAKALELGAKQPVDERFRDIDLTSDQQ